MIESLWVPVTLAAAAFQTARNAAQRSLTQTLGVGGSAWIRFLYGLPFAAAFLALEIAVTDLDRPHISGTAMLYSAVGGGAQIAATMLLLAAMERRAFSVATATSKVEPVIVAILGMLLLQEDLSVSQGLAIAIATLGVLILSPRGDLKSHGGVLLGAGSGFGFAVAAIAYRAGILALDGGAPHIRAAIFLVLTLVLQSAMILIWLAAFDRNLLQRIVQLWRPSLAAGFFGATASAFWFFGFALTKAANVRTLALVEVLMAQFVSHRIFRQKLRAGEYVGMSLIVAGTAILIMV